MTIFVKKSTIPASAREVYDWHARPGALERLNPPWEQVTVTSRTGGIQDGGVVEFSVKAGPFSVPWKAAHPVCEPGRMFKDIQVRGPFARWEHTHIFTPQDEQTSILEDSIEYALPLPPFGGLVGGAMVRSKLEKMFRFRHAVTRNDLALHKAMPLPGIKTIAITGASGLIGGALVPFLTTGGYKVLRLVRQPPKPGSDEIFWDPARGEMDEAALAGVDAVIHLAGENIGEGSWTREKKKRMLGSRVLGTRLVAQALARMKNPPKVFVCASAIGWYGEEGYKKLTGYTPQRRGFSSALCGAWELEAAPAREAGIRTVLARIGVVFTPAGGALAKMLPAFKMGVGGAMGPGRQYLSWIAPDDVLGAFLHVMAHEEVAGPVNFTAPHPATSRQVAQTLGRVLCRPAVFTVPAFALKTAFGQMADEILLASARVVPRRLLDTGYSFLFPGLGSALCHVLGRHEDKGSLNYFGD